jgi:hypothetical protein
LQRSPYFRGSPHGPRLSKSVPAFSVARRSKSSGSSRTLTETKINAVNAAENNPRACVYGTAAFLRGPEIETARNKIGAYHILKVLIVGVLTESGLRSVAPVASFSVEKIDERVA